MTARTSHNGGRSQVNLDLIQIGGDFAFINHLKSAQEWTLIDNSGVPTPDTLDTNGYPISISNGGVYTVFFKPSASARPGNWVVGWLGNGTIFNGNGLTTVSGSNSGANGRWVVSTSATRMVFGISSINVGNPIRSLWFVHEDEEADFLAGEVFSSHFKNKLIEGGFGVIRFLDWQNCNLTNIAKWDERKPVDYVFYSANEKRLSLYGGVTTNSGDDYSVTAPSGWVGLVDKAKVVVKFNASALGDSATLNVGGAGAVPIRDLCGDVTTAGNNTRPLVNKYGCLTYDADLGVFVKNGGDLGYGSNFLSNAVPYEHMVRLCEEVGAHPWFCEPYLASDPITDFMSSLATYCRVRPSYSWMIPRYEGINEQWNFGVSFNGTRYGWNKALAHWGVSTDTHNFQGKIISDLGQAISAVYGNDRTKYKVVCGVQSATAPSSSDSRLNSTRYVSINGGSAAKNWVTDVCIANYRSSTKTATEELQLAYDYSLGDLTTVDTYVAANTVDNGSALTNTQGWYTWATGFGVPMNLCNYEGGWSPDLLSSNNTATITGVTNAANCVITVASGSILPPVGTTVTPSGVSGATGVNSQTMTVTAVNSGTRQITTSFDSTAAGTYTSGGTLTLVNSKTLRNAIRLASKRSPLLVGITTRNYQATLDAGGEFPSCYNFAIEKNNTSETAWPVLVDIYETPDPPQWTGIKLFNARRRSVRLTATA